MSTSEYIYLISRGNNRKVGKSRSMFTRLKSHQTWTGKHGYCRLFECTESGSLESRLKKWLREQKFTDSSDSDEVLITNISDKDEQDIIDYISKLTGSTPIADTVGHLIANWVSIFSNNTDALLPKYGYQICNNIYICDEQEQQVLYQIGKTYFDPDLCYTELLDKLSHDLTEKGIKNRDGNSQWTVEDIDTIISENIHDIYKYCSDISPFLTKGDIPKDKNHFGYIIHNEHKSLESDQRKKYIHLIRKAVLKHNKDQELGYIYIQRGVITATGYIQVPLEVIAQCLDECDIYLFRCTSPLLYRKEFCSWLQTQGFVEESDDLDGMLLDIFDNNSDVDTVLSYLEVLTSSTRIKTNTTQLIDQLNSVISFTKKD